MRPAASTWLFSWDGTVWALTGRPSVATGFAATLGLFPLEQVGLGQWSLAAPRPGCLGVTSTQLLQVPWLP